MELGRAIPHNININPSSNKGFIVNIGCASFVAINSGSLLSGLEEYLNDPIGMEKKLNEQPTYVGQDRAERRKEASAGEGNTAIMRPGDVNT